MAYIFLIALAISLIADAVCLVGLLLSLPAESEKTILAWEAATIVFFILVVICLGVGCPIINQQALLEVSQFCVQIN